MKRSHLFFIVAILLLAAVLTVMNQPKPSHITRETDVPSHSETPSSNHKNHSEIAQTPNDAAAVKQLQRDRHYQEDLRDRFASAVTTLQNAESDDAKQAALETIEEHIQAAKQDTFLRTKLEELVKHCPPDVLHDLLYDLTKLEHPIDRALIEVAASRNLEDINQVILLHLESTSGNTFSDLPSALQWASSPREPEDF